MFRTSTFSSLYMDSQFSTVSGVYRGPPSGNGSLRNMFLPPASIRYPDNPDDKNAAANQPASLVNSSVAVASAATPVIAVANAPNNQPPPANQENREKLNVADREVSSELLPPGDERDLDKAIQKFLFAFAFADRDHIPVCPLRDPIAVQDDLTKVIDDGLSSTNQRKWYDRINLVLATSAAASTAAGPLVAAGTAFVGTFTSAKIGQLKYFDKISDTFAATNAKERSDVITNIQAVFRKLGHNHIISYIVAKYGKDGILVAPKHNALCLKNLANIIAIAKAIVVPARIDLIQKTIALKIKGLTKEEAESIFSPLAAACRAVLRDEGSEKSAASADDKMQKFYNTRNKHTLETIENIKQKDADQKAVEEKIKAASDKAAEIETSLSKVDKEVKEAAASFKRTMGEYNATTIKAGFDDQNAKRDQLAARVGTVSSTAQSALTTANAATDSIASLKQEVGTLEQSTKEKITETNSAVSLIERRVTMVGAAVDRSFTIIDTKVGAAVANSENANSKVTKLHSEIDRLNETIASQKKLIDSLLELRTTVEGQAKTIESLTQLKEIVQNQTTKITELEKLRRGLPPRIQGPFRRNCLTPKDTNNKGELDSKYVSAKSLSIRTAAQSCSNSNSTASSRGSTGSCVDHRHSRSLPISPEMTIMSGSFSGSPIRAPVSTAAATTPPTAALPSPSSRKSLSNRAVSSPATAAASKATTVLSLLSSPKNVRGKTPTQKSSAKVFVFGKTTPMHKIPLSYDGLVRTPSKTATK